MPWLKLQPFRLSRFSKKAWNPYCGIQYGICSLLVIFLFHVGSHDLRQKFSATSKKLGTPRGGGRPTHPPPCPPPPPPPF